MRSSQLRGPGNVLAHRETANEHCAVLQISQEGLRKISTLGFVLTCVVDGECTNKISLLKWTPGARKSVLVRDPDKEWE